MCPPRRAINADVDRDAPRKDVLQRGWRPFGETPCISQRSLSDGGEFMHPVMGTSLSHREQKREDFLQGGAFEIEEKK
jgi:hypothetical protein